MSQEKSEGWMCPVCGRGVSPLLSFCDHPEQVQSRPLAPVERWDVSKETVRKIADIERDMLRGTMLTGVPAYGMGVGYAVDPLTYMIWNKSVCRADV